MKNVVIISGHPDLKISLANKTILDEIAAQCPQAEIRKLDELYPDYKFDIKAEQAALERADIIVYHFRYDGCARSCLLGDGCNGSHGRRVQLSA